MMDVRPDKPATVRDMFARIARTYDRNNRLHSMGQDQRWRRRAVQAAEVEPPDAILDVACGTGELTAEFDRAGAERVAGLDCCEPMLAEARRKFAHRPIAWIEGDAEQLPFPADSFDVVSIAFGIRNVRDPDAALREFRRVLRPGGRLVVLEFAGGRGRTPLQRAARWYIRHVLPRTARLLAGGHGGAYHYLQHSITQYQTAGELAERIRSQGFWPVRTVELTLGLVALHVAGAADAPG